MFQLEIETNGAAFEDDCPAELARLLRELAERIESIVRHNALGEYSGGLRDLNGNTVAHWSIEQKR